VTRGTHIMGPALRLAVGGFLIFTQVVAGGS
jgi:hypothetical protein